MDPVLPLRLYGQGRRVQVFTRLLILWGWPLVIAAQLATTAFVAEPPSRNATVAIVTYSALAYGGSLLNLWTLFRPFHHKARALATGATVMALMTRAIWVLLAPGPRHIHDRLVADMTYFALAVATLIVGLAATRVVTQWEAQQ